MENKKIIIAIDGYSACGKSTLAKQLAKELGYIFIDTGAMYRAVTLFFLEKNINYQDIQKVQQALANISITFYLSEGSPRTYLNGQDVEEKIRTMSVASHVSEVSAIPAVRAMLVAQQQKMGKAKGVVLDGRDIGTVVFPDAALKLFITASPEARATRRYKELIAQGKTVTYESILRNVNERDLQDTTRIISPLKKAVDAIEIDNTHLSINEQFELVKKIAYDILSKC